MKLYGNFDFFVAEVLSDAAKAQLQRQRQVPFIGKKGHVPCTGLFSLVQHMDQQPAVCCFVKGVLGIIDAIDLQHGSGTLKVDGARREQLLRAGDDGSLFIADIDAPAGKIGKNVVAVPVHVLLIRGVEPSEILKVFPGDGKDMALRGQSAVGVFFMAVR